MMWFLVEFTAGDSWFKTAMVKAKRYEEACEKISKIHGDGTFKLLGMFEKSEIDANVFNRIG